MILNPLNRKQLSDEVAYNFYEAAKKLKRETGKSVGDVLIELIYNPDTPAQAKAQAIRVFYEVVSTFLDDEQAEELMEIAETAGLDETH